MKKRAGTCFKKHDNQAPRTWWEPPYVVYAFTNPRVWPMLERLMGTIEVRITDREFMLKLQKRRREYHEQMLRKRIHDREVGEVERVKRLILDGKMPVEEAPEELSEHPVLKVSLLKNKILQEEKLKAIKKRRMKKVEKLNYELFEDREKEEVEDCEVSSCIDLDMNDMERDRRLHDREEYIAHGLANFTEEDYERIKYVDPLVQDLQDVEGVDELYTLADEIVGPLTLK